MQRREMLLVVTRYWPQDVTVSLRVVLQSIAHAIAWLQPNSASAEEILEWHKLISTSMQITEQLIY